MSPRLVDKIIMSVSPEKFSATIASGEPAVKETCPFFEGIRGMTDIVESPER
jgi:hypothetical protein